MPAINLPRQWSSRQALILVTVCLALGIGGGWLIRGFQGTQNPSLTARPANSEQAATASAAPQNVAQPPNTAQLKQMADAQAAPLVAKLNSNPRDVDTIIALGNLYYDAKQYPVAVDYYNQALQSRTSDASVRTDMATAYWYMGNTDVAIAEFNKALTYAPTSPNTLFNLGLVKWKAKHDGAGAIADWQKLLTANPKYDQREKVLQMLSEVEKQSSAKNSAGS